MKPGSLVPVRREVLSAEVLSAEVLAPEYQQVVGLLAERRATGGQPLNCRAITVLSGLEVVPVKIEGCAVQAQAARCAGMGAHEPTPGRFARGDGRDGGMWTTEDFLVVPLI